MVKTISQTTGYFWWQELNKIWCRAKIKLKCFHKTERFGFGQISSWQRQGSFSYSIEKQGRKKREKGGEGREKEKKKHQRERRAATATEAGEKGGTYPRASKPQVSIGAVVLQFLQMISNQRSLFLTMHPKGPQQFLYSFCLPIGLLLHNTNFFLFQVNLFYYTHLRGICSPSSKANRWCVLPRSVTCTHHISTETSLPVCPRYAPNK